MRLHKSVQDLASFSQQPKTILVPAYNPRPYNNSVFPRKHSAADERCVASNCYTILAPREKLSELSGS